MYPTQRARRDGAAQLQEGWVIANHILVSFHVAFISSVLALPPDQIVKWEVLEFIFTSPETLVSALFVWITFHTAIAIHEMGHFLTAARLSALNESIADEVRSRLEAPWPSRALYYLSLFVKIPYGRAVGVKREGLNYYPDAPFNLAVAAAGPRASRNLAAVMLPPAIALLAWGLWGHEMVAIYAGRLMLGMGVVGLLDRFLADPGKYRAFRDREARAREQAEALEAPAGSWFEEARRVEERMLGSRLQHAVHPRLGPVTAPWQFRNCGMGGRHTEKEYPESNISMQEAMFLILRAGDYQDAQEMTVRLQNRLKEIIESEPGCRVMGIGLEGGLAPYIDRGDYPLPEVRLWAMMKRAIEEVGMRPGVDVAIALDPAMSELENAYRDEMNMPDAVGMYLFWRDEAQTVLDRDGVLDVYVNAMRDYEIPILSIEDGFSERDAEGWKMILEALGDRILVIGDDLVTTNDRTIEEAASQGLINAALIKANQIGSLYETLLAMLVALGKGLELVVSHRSKSPNDDMEAQIALAVNSLGLKCGGGANTERLVKYQSVAELMMKAEDPEGGHALAEGEQAIVKKIRAYEEPTNAGIPTVGATVELELAESGMRMRFRGATPLGTSAGTGEAIHLVDSMIERSEHREVVGRRGSFFVELEPGVVTFAKDVDEARVEAADDEDLTALFTRARRYGGKGCLTAADNVEQIIAPYFEGRGAEALGLRDIDAGLLGLELRTTVRRDKIDEDAAEEERVHVMQRKQNLGMNAMLSASLGLARAVANVQGKELYELLREEMMSIVDRVAATHGVEVRGSSLADYVEALREVTALLEEQGVPLYQALREATGIYSGSEKAPLPRPRRPAAAAAKQAEQPPAPAPAPSPAAARPEPVTAARPVSAPPASVPAVEPAELGEDVLELDQLLFRAHVIGDAAVRPGDALRAYLDTKRVVAQRTGHFGIVNNRLYRGEGVLMMPYLARDVLTLHVVREEGTEVALSRRFPVGTIYTDALLTKLAGIEAEPLDLEGEIFGFDAEQAGEVRITRLRDVASVLRTVNESTNRNEAVYWLRHLVARLSSLSARSFLEAKNLQPEVDEVREQLVELLDGRISRRAPFLARIVVRNLSSLIGKPNRIDRLWNDTIDLAEVHVRGSAIVNELRRKSHHALGTRTLELARAYRAYLRDGQTASLVVLGFDGPSAADKEARRRSAPAQIVERVVRDLEALLGTSDVGPRIEEWKESYHGALMRCEFGASLEDELETLLKQGIEQRNRWSYLHHLRILESKAASLRSEDGVGATFLAALRELAATTPTDDGFDAAKAADKARGAVERFVEDLLASHERDLFEELDAAVQAYEHSAPLEAYRRVRELRARLRGPIEVSAFREQRYLLWQLDCLLEEMGYLAGRHVATRQLEGGVQLDECLEVIRLAILDLRYDGLYSRVLVDLGAMLTTQREDAAVLDVLESIERVYHRIRRRATMPYEKMRERLGLSPTELRNVLGNIQRYMHDLNTMAQLGDLARAFLRDRLEAQPSMVPGPQPEAELQLAEHPVVHISHRDQLRKLVEDEAGALALRERYGGKGSGLIYISYLDLPTRDGFILPTSVGRADICERDPAGFQSLLNEHMAVLEKDLERRDGEVRRFGDPDRPLVVAVRGGSVFSMPGILSTVVFAGMNDRIAEKLAEDDPWCAWDSYRRFLASWSAAVWGVDLEASRLVEETKNRYGVKYKADLPWEAMREIAEASKTVLQRAGLGAELEAVLEDPPSQLRGAVRAVLRSWISEPARRYREIKGISDVWHTAAIVQEMAHGNRSNDAVGPGMDETVASLTGVVPRTVRNDRGVRVLTGELKFSAAGDDLVGGVSSAASLTPIADLDRLMPMLERRLRHCVGKLRRYMGTDQEVEFTVERGVLSILQARSSESRVDTHADRMLEPGVPQTRGIGVRGGGFRGIVAFDHEGVEELRARDLADRDDVDGVMLVIENPTPDDIPTILEADGLLTARGGSTSHAAVAVNGIEDRSFHAVMGAANLRVHGRKHEALIVDGEGKILHRVHAGDVLSIHGTTGEVFVGSRPVLEPATPRPSRPPPAHP